MQKRTHKISLTKKGKVSKAHKNNIKPELSKISLKNIMEAENTSVKNTISDQASQIQIAELNTNTSLSNNAAGGSGINVHNTYTVLPNDVDLSNTDTDDDEYTTVLKKSRKNPNIQNTNKTSTPEQTDNTLKREKMPPINVFVEDIKQIINVLKHSCRITNFQTKRIHNTKSCIQLYTREDYNNVLNKLKSCGVQLFTYTPKQDKTKTFVLKGLGHSDTTEDIKDALLEEISSTNYKLNIAKVSRFSSADNPKQIPFFIVQITQESSSSDLLKIKALLHRQITWEKLKKPEVTQCYRCQRYGHVATQCNMSYRCVKCGKSDHLPGKCLIERESDRSSLYCVQCKSNGHPASFRGCPKYQELIQKIREKRRNNIDTTNNNNLANPNVTFSQIVSQNTEQHNTNNNNATNINDLFKKIQDSLNQINMQIASFEIAQKLNAQNIDFLFDVLKIDKNIQG